MKLKKLIINDCFSCPRAECGQNGTICQESGKHISITSREVCPLKLSVGGEHAVI